MEKINLPIDPKSPWAPTLRHEPQEIRVSNDEELGSNYSVWGYTAYCPKCENKLPNSEVLYCLECGQKINFDPEPENNLVDSLRFKAEVALDLLEELMASNLTESQKNIIKRYEKVL